jgi:hypothetical protein
LLLKRTQLVTIFNPGSRRRQFQRVLAIHCLEAATMAKGSGDLSSDGWTESGSGGATFTTGFGALGHLLTKVERN